MKGHKGVLGIKSGDGKGDWKERGLGVERCERGLEIKWGHGEEWTGL